MNLIKRELSPWPVQGTFFAAFLLSQFRIYVLNSSLNTSSEQLSHTLITQGGIFLLLVISFVLINKYIQRFFSIQPLIYFFESPLFIPFVLISSLILQVALVLKMPAYPNHGALANYLDGIKIANGTYFSDAANFPEGAIGYKVFVGALFFIFKNSILSVKIAQIILHLGSSILIYQLAIKMFKKHKVAAFALALVALYPNQIFYTGLLWSETLLLFLTLLSFYLLMIARNHTPTLLAAGASCGIATLVWCGSPIYPLLYHFLILLFSLNSSNITANIIKSIRQLSIIYVALLLVVSPWIMRNYDLYHKINFSTNIGDSRTSDLKNLNLKNIFGHFIHIYSSDMDGAESIAESTLPTTINAITWQKMVATNIADASNNFPKPASISVSVQAATIPRQATLNKMSVDSNYNKSRSLANNATSALTKVYALSSNGDYILKENISENEGIQAAKIIFAFPFLKNTETTLITTIKFINSTFYYWVLMVFLALTLPFLGRLPSRYNSSAPPLEHTLLGIFFILTTTVVYSFTINNYNMVISGARYHVTIMPWIFIYFSYYLQVMRPEWAERY